jgi:hypothetical protein
MRKFKIGLITLAASAAVLAPAGVAFAGGSDDNTPLVNIQFCNNDGAGSACSPVTTVGAALAVCPSTNVAALMALQLNGTAIVCSPTSTLTKL